ncbi:hypothetical protein D9758_002524 [Tetrapyrgos nigripes]|uniref:Uncharacterized protein n=1 Tax=Tetrapyrgos nigripes TaxID=182062 RepID=A0A8H5GQD3_9AGAR|nr:hypothetical protein D9758_002524 [Tetrapyrgos nigripes]
MLAAEAKRSASVGYLAELRPHPPRNPPTGFFGAGAVPMFGVVAASFLTTRVVDRKRPPEALKAVRERERVRSVEAMKFTVTLPEISNSPNPNPIAFVSLTTMSTAEKRKLPENANYKTRKKQRQADARTIRVQTPQENQNAVAGPSRLAPSITNNVDFTVIGMKGLPSAIDVERFAESRAFEIHAMQTAMQASASSSTTRAWQVLPRHLRRRAASHDPRRVPVRLREKARAEMDPVKKPKKASKKPGKQKRALLKSDKFLKRQRDKSWLETHLWHAKRMHMEDMWGYRLAVTPTEKAFRPSHRASIHGSILHDASYHSFIELKGPVKILVSILETCCDAQGPSPGAQRYTLGSRILNTHIYQPKRYPLDMISPVIIMWRPPSPPAVSTKKSKKQKGKEKEAPLSGEPDRTVWICSHPSVMREVFAALQVSASLVLDAIRESGSPEVALELAPLHGQVNMFEIMGPKSSQVIKGALSPVMKDQSEDFQKFWTSLTNLQCTGSLPRGMVIGFTVHDPRLKFPPKNAQVQLPDSGAPTATLILPSSALAQSNLWEKTCRDKLKKPHYTKQQLDQRRSQNLIPGTPLSSLRQDDRVPVILIQRSVESGNGDSIHGWTLIVPAGWSMAFLPSLIHTGTRVGGQRERQTQAFEAGSVYFPRDYPGLEAYDEYAETRGEGEKAKWDRTPPAKRVNYKKLGTRSPWIPDWEVVVGLEQSNMEHEDDNRDEDEEDLVTTQRPEGDQQDGEGEEDTEMDHVEANDEQQQPPQDEEDGTGTMDVDEQFSPDLLPWLFIGPDISTIVLEISTKPEDEHAKTLLDAINKLRAKRSLNDLSVLKGFPSEAQAQEVLLKSALVNVKVSMHSKGSPDDLAMIYSIPEPEWDEWREAINRKPSSVDDDLVDIGGGDNGGAGSDGSPHVKVRRDVEELSKIIPPPSSIIGYVTTGNYSLSRGGGFAIGAIPLLQYLKIHKKANEGLFSVDSNRAKSSFKAENLFVKVRDRRERSVGWRGSSWCESLRPETYKRFNVSRPRAE